MIRNILTKGLGAGAVASAAAPSTSQCRAQINHPAPTMKTGKMVEEWSLHDFENGFVMFEPAEIKEAVDDIMSLAPRARSTEPSSVTISEVGSEHGSESQESETLVAYTTMEESEHLMIASNEMQSQFSGILYKLLNDPRVQQECLRALSSDPNFNNAVANMQSEEYAGHLNSLLPEAARNAAEAFHADDDGTGKNPLQHLMAAIGEGLKHLGQTMSHGCAAVGDFMIGLGYQIHNLLRRQFRPTGQAFRVEELRVPSPDIGLQGAAAWFTRAVITVACAVVALLVLRRAGARAAAS